MSGLIVHEWLEKHGGAESVVEQFGQLYPSAEIFCLWDDHPERFKGRSVRESWLSSTPLRRSKPLALPFMLPAWRGIPIKDVDWILCSSHLFAHHARLINQDIDVRKFVYAHTPARYIWNPELDERGNKYTAKVASSLLRKIDRRRAAEATSVAANSRFVQERIQSAWDLPSTVIHPPVDVGYFAAPERGSEELSNEETKVLERLPSEFILGASRFVPYKGMDKVIQAGIAANLPVVLAGDGPELQALRQQAEDASVPVTILRGPSRPLLRALYRRALVYVFPPVEDFGIMPVEAMATGTPVIANRAGGAGESVVHGTSGVLIEEFGPSGLRAAISAAADLQPDKIRLRAEEFAQPAFRQRVLDWMS